MKKAKTAKWLSSIIALTLAVTLCFGLTSCVNDDGGNNGPNPDDDKPGPTVTIEIGDAPSTITKGDAVTLTVTVTGTDEKDYKWSIDHEDILTINNQNVVRVLDDAVVGTDTVVTVTATLTADATKSASKAFNVRPSVEGQVGDLTAAMIEEISGYNITFEGTLSDVYIDNVDTSMSSRDTYNFKVMMDGEDDGDEAGGTNWYGEWSKAPEVDGDPAGETVSSNYQRGDVVQSSGKHRLMHSYVNLQNEVTTVAETSYDSTPLYWEDNHLWNHLIGLGADITNKFEHDLDNDVYRYLRDFNPAEGDEYSDDAYLLTYLAVSMTPLLSTEETFDNVYFKVENGHISRFYGTTIAQTAMDENGSTVLQQSYTEVVIEIKDIGSTVVPSPAPFEEPAHADILSSALTKMKSAKNYTFSAVQNEVYTAMPDEGEYESLASISTFGVMPIAATGYYSHPVASGTVGVVGRVTNNIILLTTTGEYTSYDGDQYHIDYDGYRQYDDYFEEFSSHPVWREEGFKYLVGTRRISGDMFEKAVPQWNFSPNIFKYGGMNEDGNGKSVYKFVLRDTSVTADVAMQISMHNYAENGAAATFKTLTLYVDGEGNITKTEFPYDVSGNYVGYITTTFSNVGNTTIEEGNFTSEFYHPREYKDTWDKYAMRYYYPGDGTTQDNNYNCATAMKEIFGEDAYKLLPPPTVFMDVFGDVVYGPFYDSSPVYADEDHTIVDHEVKTVSINTEFFRMDYPDNVDSNNRAVNIAEIIGENSPLAQAMAKYGFEYSPRNSGWGTNGDYFGSFINEEAGLIISVENNQTLNIFIEIHKIGDWTLDRRS